MFHFALHAFPYFLCILAGGYGGYRWGRSVQLKAAAALALVKK